MLEAFSSMWQFWDFLTAVFSDFYPDSRVTYGSLGLTQYFIVLYVFKQQANIMQFVAEDGLWDAMMAKDWKKTVCNLMAITFSKDELQNCSVTGRSSEGSDARPPLSFQRVQAIIG
jgi:hypothetical protein